MLQEFGKNLWLLLTIVIPGLFTYGAWRLLLLLEPGKRVSGDALKLIDDSAITATAIIIAVALLQQAVAITVEAILTFAAMIRKRRWPNLYILFCDRFALSASGKMNENATRIIGNFFMSVNVSVGLALLLVYFLAYEGIRPDHWIPVALACALAVALTTAAFRMLNAKWAIAGCGKIPPGTKTRAAPKHAK